MVINIFFLFYSRQGGFHSEGRVGSCLLLSKTQLVRAIDAQKHLLSAAVDSQIVIIQNVTSVQLQSSYAQLVSDRRWTKIVFKNLTSSLCTCFVFFSDGMIHPRWTEFMELVLKNISRIYKRQDRHWLNFPVSFFATDVRDGDIKKEDIFRQVSTEYR